MHDEVVKLVAGLRDAQPILHHYRMSNFSEKVRLILDFKGLQWLSVEIPSTAPKPDYEPLTAGYRRTPALQIGADVFCDTRLIADVLEAIAPVPTLFPGDIDRHRALADALRPWAESALLWPIALDATGHHAERLGLTFHHDRARLHRRSPPSIAQVQAAGERARARWKPQLRWVNGLLADGRRFLEGDAAGLVDFTVYPSLWFMEAVEGPHTRFDQHPETVAWMRRIAGLRRPAPDALSPVDALARAQSCPPIAIEPCPPPPRTDASEYRLALGEAVWVAPHDEDAPARGTLVRWSEGLITIRTDSPRVGAVHVHFPTWGYRIRAL
ncbi:MAG: glutathione S-transferase family protein [Pseudomonadota bacterium]